MEYIIVSLVLFNSLVCNAMIAAIGWLIYKQNKVEKPEEEQKTEEQLLREEEMKRQQAEQQAAWLDMMGYTGAPIPRKERD